MSIGIRRKNPDAFALAGAGQTSARVTLATGGGMLWEQGVVSTDTALRPTVLHPKFRVFWTGNVGGVHELGPLPLAAKVVRQPLNLVHARVWYAALS